MYFALAFATAASVPIVRGDTYDPPANYYASATGTGSTLKQQLYTITSSNFTYRSYGDSRYTLNQLWQDPTIGNSGNLIAIYSSKSVTGAWDGGVTWNREHIMTENSLGISVSNSYLGYGSDQFELAPAVPSDNESRSNLGYGFTGSTSTPARGNYGSVKSPTGVTYWNAGPQFEGDAARTLFYMATRYGTGQGVAGTQDASNKYNVTLANGTPTTTGQFGDLNTLLHWAYEDPVDAFERRKNALVYSGLTINGVNASQGNRNPYIDHPEYIWAVFGTKANTSQLSIGTPAADGSSTTTVNLGRVIAGSSFGSSTLTLNKTGDTPTTFNVTAGGNATSSLAGTGEAFTFDPGSKTMSVGLGTSSAAGMVTGNVVVDNTDLTTAAAGQGAADGNDVVTVTGTAVDHSDASFSTLGDVKVLNLSFGVVSQGSGTLAFSFNLANLLSASGYTAGLDLDAVTGTGNTAVLTTDLVNFADLTAGTAVGFHADFSTNAAGLYSAEYTLNVSDENIPGATAGQNLILDLSGDVVSGVPLPTSCKGALAVFVLLAAGTMRRRTAC